MDINIKQDILQFVAQIIKKIKQANQLEVNIPTRRTALQLHKNYSS